MGALEAPLLRFWGDLPRARLSSDMEKIPKISIVGGKILPYP
nr:MAG TPA_asm: hypothetical protein [Caudoviricetes sp.]